MKKDFIMFFSCHTSIRRYLGDLQEFRLEGHVGYIMPHNALRRKSVEYILLR